MIPWELQKKVADVRQSVEDFFLSSGSERERDLKKVGFSPNQQVMEYAPEDSMQDVPSLDLDDRGGATFDDAYVDEPERPHYLSTEEVNNVTENQ